MLENVRLDNLLLINVTSLQNVLTQLTAAVRQNAADIQVKKKKGERKEKGKRKHRNKGREKGEGRRCVGGRPPGQPPSNKCNLAAKCVNTDNRSRKTECR